MLILKKLLLASPYFLDYLILPSLKKQSLAQRMNTKFTKERTNKPYLEKITFNSSLKNCLGEKRTKSSSRLLNSFLRVTFSQNLRANKS